LRIRSATMREQSRSAAFLSVAADGRTKASASE